MKNWEQISTSASLVKSSVVSGGEGVDMDTLDRVSLFTPRISIRLEICLELPGRVGGGEWAETALNGAET
jgi:hypothetical protein